MPRGGTREGAGRPFTRLLIRLPKDEYKKLLAFSQTMGMPPDVVAANLIVAHLETKERPYPSPEQAELN